MLQSKPYIPEDTPKTSLTTWERYTPLTLDQIINNCSQRLDFEDENIEYKVIESVNCVITGQFLKGTQIAQGVARRVFIKGKYGGQIQEGIFKNGKLDGYGRTCYEDGDFYVGNFRHGERHGQGLYVKAATDGKNEKQLKGLFKGGQYV